VGLGGAGVILCDRFLVSHAAEKLIYRQPLQP
jgi:hypothetical protein